MDENLNHAIVTQHELFAADSHLTAAVAHLERAAREGGANAAEALELVKQARLRNLGAMSYAGDAVEQIRRSRGPFDGHHDGQQPPGRLSERERPQGPRR